MKTLLSITIMVMALCLISEAVQVKEGEFSFSLESVKVLQQLTATNPPTQNATTQSPPTQNATTQSPPNQSTRRGKTSYFSVCNNPTLPQEFVPLCMKKGATMSLARLASVPVDLCEICAFAACTGC